ncbi:MAG TPA: YdeI/OmpD-associated family protein [bacterium]|nr:YdeI/OmpD-associated family protein [bacterium]
MSTKSNLPILSFKAPEAWEKWLSKNHASSKGIWLKIFKKDSGKPTVTYAEALDGALCYGWIDGQKNGHDAESWLQKFTPRRPRSPWSKINTGHAERLMKEGRMKPAGLREVEAAKKDGRWKSAYHSQSTATYPADFLREVDKNKKAKAFLAALNSANRYAIIYRLRTAKKPETRQKRLRLFVEMLAKGQKLHP